MVAVALGLAASVSWGIADFLGGLKARSIDLLAVLAVSQAVALVVLALATAIRFEGPPGGETFAYAAVAGTGGLVGLAAFYRGLAVGAMAVVAPIGGLAAALPVVVGIATGERPGALQLAGIVLALAGVALASREQDGDGEGPRVAAGVGLALLAALGFGTFLLAMDTAGDGDVLWALLAARCTTVATLAVAVAVARPRLGEARAHLGALVAIGLLDMGANGLYAVAATEGLVSLVAVLASLYPVVTILLARVVLAERVSRPQQLGVLLVLAGVAGIAAG